MLKIIKWIGIIVVALLVIVGVLLWSNHEPLPEGESGPKAEALAQKMVGAINKPAWDSIRYVQWNFMGKHHFLWDKERHLVEVKWNNNRVLLNVEKVDGRAWIEGVEQTGASKESLIDKAWAVFINDSFWLNAPAMVFNPGTIRKYVPLENGQDGLLVTYTTGGKTPGDSYLWILNNEGLPLAYKLWVKIIPIGGVKFTWENWKTLDGGAKIAQYHDLGWFGITLSDIKTADTLRELGIQETLFQPILE